MSKGRGGGLDKEPRHSLIQLAPPPLRRTASKLENQISTFSVVGNAFSLRLSINFDKF
jgi:hypothetical protein